MIRFLLKGLWRDPSRSLFPVLIVAIGVSLTVLMQSWIGGVMGDMIRSNAHFSTGHVKVTTRAYAENEDQIPNDLSLLEVNSLLLDLHERFPSLCFVERIRFGGLLDIPDENGETRQQGPVAGLGVDLLSPTSSETDRLNIETALVRGRLPRATGEILLSDDFAHKLCVDPGALATVISSTMHGSMAMHNVVIAGTVRFGVGPMDRGAIIVDLADARFALDMHDAAGEVLGYFKDDRYRDDEAARIAREFNVHGNNPTDEFSPIMRALRDQNDLAEYLDLARHMTGILSGVFILAMSIVLWNLGLIGGIRRYGEIGVRLAIGEDKGAVYRSVLLESVLIGLMGSIIGTVVGLGVASYLQIHGFDISLMMDNSSMMLSNVMRARITSQTFYVGFIPGLFATVLGSALSGIGIYRRQTAHLFKELEV